MERNRRNDWKFQITEGHSIRIGVERGRGAERMDFHLVVNEPLLSWISGFTRRPDKAISLSKFIVRPQGTARASLISWMVETQTPNYIGTRWRSIEEFVNVSVSRHFPTVVTFTRKCPTLIGIKGHYFSEKNNNYLHTYETAKSGGSVMRCNSAFRFVPPIIFTGVCIIPWTASFWFFGVTWHHLPKMV